MVRTLRSHKILGISWLCEQLLGSQEGPCSVRTVYMVHTLLFIADALNFALCVFDSPYCQLFISARGARNKYDGETVTTILNGLYLLGRCGALLWIQHSTQSGGNVPL